ncbi:MAG: hypothetical protein HFF03_04295 [Oscillospiraceae bacterium]|jgi:hypothetical protein|nr:hypothetical protein [Oscillospiraceae bacterium]
MNSADILEVLVGCGLVLGFLISRVIKIVRSEARKESKAPTRKKQTPKADTYTSPRTTPGASAAKTRPSFRSEAADHEHITVGGRTREARLEQLETLLDAGLLDREEYRERKRRIEEEMG